MSRSNRPLTGLDGHRCRTAPPPTRRSTLSLPDGIVDPAGSSAHAEIDPLLICDHAAQLRLLRPRGDRPFTESDPTRVMLAPPPTRRSTLYKGPAIMGMFGSSAHAEIDPLPDTRERHLNWLLRPRGDRPRRGRCRYSACAAPPPTRRSTRYLSSFFDLLQAPPPTRRSTHLSRVDRTDVFGSSAHAEIDPGDGSANSADKGLLRPRGDRPTVVVFLVSFVRAPPPTRRSTR